MRKKEFVVQDSSRERGELDKREHKPLETLACPDAAGKELCFFISHERSKINGLQWRRYSSMILRRGGRRRRKLFND